MLVLTQMERTQSLQFWFILGPNILLENQKYCLRPKNSGKTRSLGISNNISPRYQKYHIILIKLTKNKLFGPNLGINCSLRPHQRVIRNSHIANKRTVHLDTKFQLLVLDFTQKKQQCFFFFKTQLDPFFYFLFILFYLSFVAVVGWRQ